MFPFGITVTVERPGGVNEYGQELPGTSHTIEGCGWWPQGSAEIVNGQDVVTTQDRIMAPFGSDVLPVDSIVLNDSPKKSDTRYRVDGKPTDWDSPLTGWQPGMVINLKSAE